MQASNYTRYLILLSHTGKPFSEALIRAHVRHLKRLDQEKKLVLCGPFKNYQGGMVLIRAESYEDAILIANSDPFVEQGVERFEIRELELSCDENNHLGMA